MYVIVMYILINYQIKSDWSVGESRLNRTDNSNSMYVEHSPPQHQEYKGEDFMMYVILMYILISYQRLQIDQQEKVDKNELTNSDSMLVEHSPPQHQEYKCEDFMMYVI